MQAPLRNYHTHTWRCQHARGTEEAYVREAIRQGFSVLGFSDHTPWPYKSGFVSGMRMRLDQFGDYRRVVLDLRERYAGQIEIPLGLECEAFPEYFGWLADFKAQYLDYVILGNHYDATDEGDQLHLNPSGGFYFGKCTRPEQIRRYAQRTIAGMRTGLYDYVAHPDLFLHAYPRFDGECRAVSRDLCQAALSLNLPLEYNLLGLYRSLRERVLGWQCYPNALFWEIAAETGCTAIIGYDAHESEALSRRELYDQARATLCALGMRVIDTL